ncbi:ParA family protein [Hassallia byssoidea VB512170]|uniref:ParA family protein n=1 Tax=Hassallia byssoidea VB512170 TaxID=1304833 RepID=A0A846HH52_9CYAN|nr:ParA family protein [Hassalia byssoidea]NEU76696.1 ParA family protein [Hassalia byssoidea VB512170]
MSIISFTNVKGGVGKSTTAVHFIYWLAVIKKKSVAVVDADGQGSTSAWLEAMELGVGLCRITDADELADQLPAIEKNFDYVIVDNAGNLGEATRSTLLTATTAVIPISPSGLDLMSAASAAKVVRQNQKARGGFPKAGIFINRATRNSKLSREAVDVIKEIEGITPLKQIIYRRELIADTFLQKATVWNMAGGKEASADYQKLFNEILRLNK